MYLWCDYLRLESMRFNVYAFLNLSIFFYRRYSAHSDPWFYFFRYRDFLRFNNTYSCSSADNIFGMFHAKFLWKIYKFETKYCATYFSQDLFGKLITGLTQKWLKSFLQRIESVNYYLERRVTNVETRNSTTF